MAGQVVPLLVLVLLAVVGLACAEVRCIRAKKFVYACQGVECIYVYRSGRSSKSSGCVVYLWAGPNAACLQQ